MNNSTPSLIFPMSAQNAFLIVCNASQAAGLPNVRPHDLRRTAARLMRKGGASIEQIGVVLGHSSPVVTARYLGTQLELEDGLAATDLAADPTK